MPFPFNGQLNSNEIYNMWNMIISQEVFPINVANPTLANMFRVDGTLYGDTKLYHSVDVTGSYDWLNDAEAPRLLEINRNNSVVTQAITIDVFRQTNTTIDYYLSKRAFMREGSFADFTGTLLSVLSANKQIYDNGIINVFVGTQVSAADAANVVIDLTEAGLGTPDSYSDTESYNRLRGQQIATTFSKLARDLADNRRDFNELGYMRSVDFSDLIVVWNGDRHDEVLKIDLPTIFHRDGIYDSVTEMDLPSRYFGQVQAGTTTVDGSRAVTEMDVTVAGNTEHYFPGDLIPAGATVPANSTYLTDDTIICKIMPRRAIPFMSAFTVGTVFTNARSLTENHYLTWGHNTLERIREFPFITVRVTEPTEEVTP